jgi:hypothetical protein
MMKGDNVEDHKKFVKAYEGYSEEGNRFGYAQDIINNISEYKGGAQPALPPPTPSSGPPAAESPETHVGPENPQAAPTSTLSMDQITSAITALGGNPNAPLNTPQITAPPMPANLQQDMNNGVAIQPIIIEGTTVPIGYQKSVDTGEGIAKLYFDKTGQRTSLQQLKRARLHVN